MLTDQLINTLCWLDIDTDPPDGGGGGGCLYWVLYHSLEIFSCEKENTYTGTFKNRSGHLSTLKNMPINQIPISPVAFNLSLITRHEGIKAETSLTTRVQAQSDFTGKTRQRERSKISKLSQNTWLIH